MVKRQSVFIEEMEKKYPGITKVKLPALPRGASWHNFVKRGARGEVIIDDRDEIDNGE